MKVLNWVCQLILLQVDLTRTWEILGEITGDAAPDELITQLFSQFCLGKIRKIHDRSCGHGFCIVFY